jgi:hypothetical protein
MNENIEMIDEIIWMENLLREVTICILWIYLESLWKNRMICNWVFELTCNDHLQLIAIQHISMSMSAIGQVTWVTTNVINIHYMWNHIPMQLMQLNYNHI